MKNKQPGFTGEDKAWIIGSGLLAVVMKAIPYLMVLCLMVSTAGAAAYYYKVPEYCCFGTEQDSIQYIVFTCNTATTVARDTTTYTGADTTTDGVIVDSVLLNTDTSYSLQARNWESGALQPPGTIWIPSQSATATIDYDSIQSVIFSGNGAYTTTIYAIDTSGTDDTLTGKTITARSLAGDLQAWPQATLSGGYIIYQLEDTVILSIADPWYTFSTDTVVISSDTTLDIQGYDHISPSAPAATSVCAVYGYVYELGRGGGYDAASYARVVFELPQNVTNTCDSAMSLHRVQIAETNSAGYFTINLLKSSCVQVNGNNQAYRVWVEGDDGVRTREHKLTIPDDSSTYKLVF